MKLFFRLLILVCLAVPLSAYGAREEAKIGIIYGEAFTNTAGISLDLLGTRLAIEELNRNGGILGRQIALVELNNSKTPLGSREAKAKTAVILTCTDEKFSIGLAKKFSREFVAYGGSIPWQGEYLSSFTNFQDLLTETARHKPDIVFLPGYDRPSGFIIRQSRIIGENITFLGSDAWSHGLYDFGKESIEGNYHSIFSNSKRELPFI